MNFALITTLSAFGLFFGMLLFCEIGRRIGVRRLKKNSDGLSQGVGAAEGAVFALMGLVIAFTFSGAASRFEARRLLIADEANAIGTAYLRLDLVPSPAQAELRGLFRNYVDVRSDIYQHIENDELMQAKLNESTHLQSEIWNKAITACRRIDAPSQAGMLLLPALNAMVDTAAMRQVATQNHPPLVIYLLLVVLSLAAALLVGYDTSQNHDRTWLHKTALAAIISLAVYVIVDLEYPRLGLIRIDAADQIFQELQKNIH